MPVSVCYYNFSRGFSRLRATEENPTKLYEEEKANQKTFDTEKIC